jgi:RNA polymerase sigma factor (sigma-70 family)
MTRCAPANTTSTTAEAGSGVERPRPSCDSNGQSANLAKASDAELLRLTATDGEAFGVFYDRYEREVLASFWRRTQRAELAVDLAAEVSAAALESAVRFDADPTRTDLGQARAWLYTIARRQMADAWERGRVENAARTRLHAEPLVLTDEIIELIERLDAQGTDVLRLLEELPEGQRLAVKGRVVDECDYVELSRRLCVSESVVRQRVSRGLRALRRRFDEPRPKEHR